MGKVGSLKEVVEGQGWLIGRLSTAGKAKGDDNWELERDLKATAT
jgi:hypothetical protein